MKSSKSLDLNLLRTSVIVRWVLKHGDTFPLADDYDLVSENDLPVGLKFDEHAWCNCTKKWFARYCGVTKTQIEGWIERGLPVRLDGRLNLSEANQWLDRWEQISSQGERSPQLTDRRLTGPAGTGPRGQRSFAV